MKKLIYTALCAGAMLLSSVSFAQLLDEKDITITMDLQPVLQLNLQGPTQFDFTFDDISEYYSGIVKYGANILKVSSSVSFDLWAVGLSQTTNFLWDNPVSYQAGNANALTTIPLNALELRQFPPNPSGAGVACVGMNTTANGGSDYNKPFPPLVIPFVAAQPITAATAGGVIFSAANTAPYTRPTSTATTASEKYIAGGTGVTNNCQVVGGSYLLNTFAAGFPTDTGYFFVMDYRILPGLPAIFPVHLNVATNAVTATVAINTTAGSVTSCAAAAGTLGTAGTSTYARPGVYTMYVKYIIMEDL